MDPKDLKRILDAIKDVEASEFSLETPEYKLHVKRGTQVLQLAATPAPVQVVEAPSVQPAPAPVPVQPTAAPSPAPVAAPAAPKGHTVKAPIVGTFYRSSSPDAAPFVNVGDRVEAGKVLCIIEAMKLMNEIEADVAGTVREVLVSNAQPVEYGQPLFVIE